MLSETTISDLLRAAGLDAPVRFEERTGSTQEVALAMAEAGTPAWTTVAAAHQTAGRGREGRAWSDAPGALLCSVVLRPDMPAASAGLIPLLAGAAMAEACEELLPPGVKVTCRWPNDLLLDDGDGGGKVGGILASSRLEGDRLAWVVLGIGVNVSSPPADVTDARALGAGDEAALLGAFLRRMSQMLNDDPVVAVRARYVPRCATLGRRVRARTAAGIVEGSAVGIRDDGALVISTERGERAVTSGEVIHMEKDTLTGEQRAFRDAARSFARSRANDRAASPRDHLRELGRLGFLALPLPAAIGGQDADFLSFCLCIEEFAAVDPVLARGVADATLLGLLPIATLSSDAQRSRLLPPLISGAATAALARERGTITGAAHAIVLDAPVSALEGWLPAQLQIRPAMGPEGLALVVLPIPPPGQEAPESVGDLLAPEAVLGPSERVEVVLSLARDLHGIALMAISAAGDGEHRALARTRSRVVVIEGLPRDH